ncbi:kinesin-like boursin [Dinothrombium tinctorium]|uniref:Kinesin-like boursin n=1 Tax=Dinothrombium tinctorium TaxID=1965070 RepID=A0A3S3QWC0_9ACAR|nr:kinesin-like boursin [Dinothrombium tinctorium]
MVQVSLTGPKTPAPKLNPATSAAMDCQESDQNIAVFVRCRPMKANEKKNVVEVLPEHRVIRVNDRGTIGALPNNDKLYSRTFTFDSVFGPQTEQIDVYRAVVAPLIEQVIAGYNCTVFAYGQTGTGKTFTMEGERTSEDTSWETDPLSGIIPRALHQLFETLPDSIEHSVGVSFIELYNEELYDLLSPVDDTTKLKIYDDPIRKGSVIICGLEEINVHTKAQIYEILRKGSEKRQTAATLLNACSSRSHTIFSVTVHIKENSNDGEELLKIGKLNLVDLAGSENIGRSGASDKRAREAGNINQSLLTLGRVITSLVDKTPHIPYRESKLTRLLKDSLGGRTKTSIIATISPNVADAEDTLSTLEYAQRAKKITNKPEVNQKLSKKTLLREYTAEIERLRRDLAACREKNGFYINQENYNQMVEKLDIQAKDIEEKEGALKALQEELEKLNETFDETKATLEQKEGELAMTSECLKTTERNLRKVEVDLDEQKYLADVHSKNEQVLYEKAKKLLNIADQTSSDIDKLHRKVDCQSNIEESNFEKLKVYQEKFTENMEHLQHLVQIGSDSISECLSSTEPKVKENFDTLEGKVAEIFQKLLKTETYVNDLSQKLSTAHSVDQSLVEKADCVKEKILYTEESHTLHTNEVEEEINIFRNVFEECFGKVREAITTQRAEVEALLLKQNTQMKELIDYRNQCFQNIKSALTDIFESRNSEVALLRDQVKKLIELQQESEAATVSMLNDILKRKKTFASIFAQHSDGISNTITSISSANVKQEKNTNQLLNSISESLNLRETKQINLIDEVDSLNCENIQSNVNEIDSIRANCAPHFDKASKLMSDMKDDFKRNVGESVNINEKIMKTMNENLQKKQSIVSEIDKNVLSSVFEAKSNVENVHSEVGTTKNNLMDCISNIGNQVNNWHRSYNREIVGRGSEFDFFKSSQLMKYNPTGATPQKTEYNYPRELVISSPDERLLSRYRASILEKAVVHLPLPDDDEIEEEAEMKESSLKSEGSNNGSINNENKSPETIFPQPTLSKIKTKQAKKKNANQKEQQEQKAGEIIERKKSKPFHACN